jgi:hypothetical protein
VPGKGYRFIGAAAKVERPPEAAPLPDRLRHRWRVTGIALALAAAAAVLYYAGFRPGGPSAPATPATIVVLPFKPEQRPREYFSDGLTGRLSPRSAV